jgi:hypothetical protein
VLLPVTFWNDHDQLVGIPDDVSLNLTTSESSPEVIFAVKLDTGAATLMLMYVTCVEML